MNGISAFRKEIAKSFPPTSLIGGHSEKTALCEPGSRSSPGTKSAGSLIVVDFQASRTVRNKCVVYKAPSPWSSVTEVRVD